MTSLPYGAYISYRVRAVGEGSFLDSDWSLTRIFNVCPMDINGDCDISSGDRTLLATLWLSEEGNDDHLHCCDINGDGEISNTVRSFLVGN